MTRHRTFVVTILGLALAAAAAPPRALQAQRAPSSPVPARAGDQLWFAADLGRGFARIACDICDGWREPGTSGSLRLGSRVSPLVLVGAEVGGWRHAEGVVGERFLNGGLIAQLYLPRAPDLFVKLGASYLSYRIEDDTETLGASAFGLQMGVGYDLRVASRFHLTPALTVARSFYGGRLKFNGAELDERTPLTLIQLGVGVTRK